MWRVRLAVLSILCCCGGTAGLLRAAEQGGAIVTGRYRNLFVEAGHAPADVRAKIDQSYRQLFHGDAKSKAVYFAAGKNVNGPLAYIQDIGSNDVRSEGMSYGMMIAVQLDKRAEFDALWNWAKTHMHHADPASPAFGYFSWSLKTDGTPNDEMPAPDGEEYFATALYFAANRWGNGEGIYNYRAEADRILTAMRHRKEITGPTVKGEMTAGNLFEPKRAMVRFTPDVVNWEHTDPSYHLPAFYELWAQWGPEADRDFWRQAATTSREFFQLAANPADGAHARVCQLRRHALACAVESAQRRPPCRRMADRDELECRLGLVGQGSA